MKILLASRVFPPDARSGGATLVAELWERLRTRHDVRLVVGLRGDPSLLPSEARTVRIDRERPLRYRLAMDLAVRRAAAGWRPDLVIACGLEIPVGLAPTIGLLGDPFAGADEWGRAGGLRARFVRRQVNKLTIPVIPSEAVRRRFEDFGISADHLEVAWPGIDTGRFCPPPAPEETDPQKPLRLLYAARIMPGKGQHVAIEAVKGLHSSLLDRVQLELAGPTVDPNYEAALRRRARDAPVHFVGEVADLHEHYRAADIVLFPTVMEEVFGHSAVDGMACGKPVIFSKSSALLEVTGGIGIAVPAGDVKRLAEAIRVLIKAPERRKELGEKGRAWVVERYSWDRAMQRYDEFIARAARLS